MPGELPDDAVTALLLATPFWHKPVTVDLGACAHAGTLLDEAETILHGCGCETTRQGFTLRVTPGVPRMAAAPALAMTLPLAFALLAMPGLTGRPWSSCTASGLPMNAWPHRRKPCCAAVVELHVSAGEVESAPREDAPEAWDFTDLPAELAGPALALFVSRLSASGPAKLPSLPEGVDNASRG